MAAALAAALLVPLAGAAAAAAGAVAAPLRRRGAAVLVRRVAAGTAAAAWLAVLVEGEAAAGRFAAGPTVAAAGLGAALVAATGSGSTALTMVALAAATGALAALAGDGHTGDLVAGLTVALAAATWGTGRRGWRLVTIAAPGAVAVAAVAAAAARLHVATGGLELLPQEGRAAMPAASAGLLVAGSALLVLAGGRQPRSPPAVLLPIGLGVGLFVAPLLAGYALDAGSVYLEGPQAAALGLAAAGALVAIGVPRPRAGGPPLRTGGATRVFSRFWHRRFGGTGTRGGGGDVVGAVGLWALAAAQVAAAGHGGPAGSGLLAAAAVLTAVTGLTAVTAAAVPGAALLAMALREAWDAWAAAVAVAAAVTVAAVAVPAARRPRRRVEPLRAAGRPAATSPPLAPWLRWLPPPRAVRGVGAALAAWLLVAPGTWGWVGAVPLDAWGETAAVAVPVAAASLALGAWSGRLAPAVPAFALLPERRGRRSPRRPARVAGAVGLALLGGALAWLVLSVVRVP